jgi:hypothetical protein
MVEAKRPLKAQLTAEVAAAHNDTAADAIRVAFDKKEKALENEIDHRPLESESPLHHYAPAHLSACCSPLTPLFRSAHRAGRRVQRKLPAIQPVACSISQPDC